MGNGNSEKRLPGSSEVNDELPKDIENLYSWARVEDAAPYRDFARQRKARHIRAVPGTGGETSGEPDSLKPTFEDRGRTLETPATFPAVAARTMSESAPPAPMVQARPDPISPDALNVPGPLFQPAFFEAGPSPLGKSASSSLAVYSLAGGVGKTTFCASLGRILCSVSEHILLVDASSSGLLPFYFGAGDLRTGLRTFLAPEPHYPPLQVIGAEVITKEWLDGDVKTAMLRSQRTILDLGPASASFLPEIFGMCGMILIPLLPDLNSILTVSRIEASLNAMQSKGANVPPAFYVFNRFDDKDSRHQQARGLVQRQCGDRLLTTTICDGIEVEKALASRMTVADWAPKSEVTRDFLALASWVRRAAPVYANERSPELWSER